MADNDLFGDSSSDNADTDDLIAAAKAQPIARKKDSAPPKKKAAKKGPDADAPDSDDDASEAGLFDSSSEDEGPKKKKLGGKKKGKAAAKKKPKAAAKKKGPPKKDNRSMKERMEALAKKRAAASGDGGGGDDDAEKEKPRKKRPKTDADGNKVEGENKEGDEYDSEDFERTKADDDFIDKDDEDEDALKELYAEQHFDDERPDGYDTDEEKAMKKSSGGGGKKSQGAGLDKISLSDDEGGEGDNASNALKSAVKRMQRKKKETKKLPELEEEGIAFLKRMEAAADADDASIKKRQPGFKKLGMLQEVMDTLARKDMVRVLLDLELLSTCKRWVQPLPNGALGNVTLRRRIIEAISAMSGENGVNAHDLKRSDFGKVVMTLFMHKSETPEMKKMLKCTVEQWSRPIFQKSGNLRDLSRAQAARDASESGSLVGIARAHQMEARDEERRAKKASMPRGKNEDDLAQIVAGGSKASKNDNARVRVTYSKGFQYSVRPENRTGDVSDRRNLVSAKAAANAGAGFGRESEKREAIGKRMLEKGRKTNKQTQRSANISIEGRVVK